MARQLTAEEIARRDFLTQCYDNMNAYDLVLSYIGSQRPKSGALKSDAEEGFMIHTLKPSFQDPRGVVINFQASREFDLNLDLNLPVPEVAPEDAADMKKYWRCLVTGTTDRRFWRHEGRKYMKFSKLQPVSDTFKKGLKHGKRYIDGDMNLMDILKNKGYKVGNIY